jgi:hypothetical protein
MIVFGKAEAMKEVMATIEGKGLLGEIAVVQNVEATLLTDLDFTRHPGMVLLEDDTHLIGWCNGRTIFRGMRNPEGASGTSEQLWLLDLDTLLQLPAPPARANGVRADTADDLLAIVNNNSYSSENPETTSRGGAWAGGGSSQMEETGEANAREADITSFAGGPTYSKDSVREARRAIKGCNSISARTLGKSVHT